MHARRTPPVAARTSVIAVSAALATLALFAPVTAAAASARSTSALPGPLFGVDALSANDVWAVGTRPPGGPYDESTGFAEHWDGVQWNLISGPGFGELSAGLSDVSFSGANDGWAVGSVGQASFNDTQIVVEHWNGSAWSVASAPDASFNDELSGVAAISPTDVWAVGAYDTGGTGLNAPLAEHWNGMRWRIVSLPDIGPAQLHAVEAIASNDVWAVGAAGGKTLTLHWNGSAWSRVASPNAGSATNTLTDVSAAGANDVWTVGTVESGQPFVGRTVALHWNGARWSRAPTQSPSSGDSVTGVAAFPTRTAWMVGTYWPTAYKNLGLAEHLANGTATLTSLPEKATLEGVAGVADDDVWAVGSNIFHWNGSSWTPVF